MADMKIHMQGAGKDHTLNVSKTKIGDVVTLNSGDKWKLKHKRINGEKVTLQFTAVDGKKGEYTVKGTLKESEELDESFNVHYPALKKLVNLQYKDPRTQDGCKIVAEKCGKIKKENGEVANGSFIMYEDSELKGKYIAVHVTEEINEESGESDVTVIAIGNKQKVRERMGYRIRRNKNLEESKTLELNKKLIK